MKTKNEGKKLIEKSKNEITAISGKAWKKSVKPAFNTISSTENITLKDIYPDENIPEIDEIKSIQINYPSNFYSCYFKYQSDKTENIKFLSDLNTNFPDISDAETEKTN